MSFFHKKTFGKKFTEYFTTPFKKAKKMGAPWNGLDGVKVVLLSTFTFAALIFGGFFLGAFLIDKGIFLPNIDALLEQAGLGITTKTAVEAEILDGFGVMSLLLMQYMKVALVGGIALQVGLQLGFLYLYSKVKYGTSVKDFGFHRVGLASFFFMVVLLFIMSSLVQNGYLSFMDAIGFHRAEENGAAEQMIVQGQIPLPVLIIFAGVIAPILEELIFRGFLMAGFLRKSGATYALVFSALIFALAHTNPGVFLPEFTNGEVIFSSPTSDELVSTFILMPIYFILGIMLGFSFLKTKSLYPGIVFHMINNNAALFLLLMKLNS